MSNLFDEIRNNPKYNIKQSWAWYQGEVNKLTGGPTSTTLTPNKMIQDNKSMLVTNIMPGFMYAFRYDPKHKDTLPVYDTFPLVLPFSKHGQYFTGLNLHYLSTNMRFNLLNKLMLFANNKNMDANTKLIYSWKLIGHTSKLKEVGPCVKQYIIGHVTSKFLKIPPVDWRTAILLPTQQFKGEKAQSVWRRSTQHVLGKQ